jgi:hypothetical protein
MWYYSEKPDGAKTRLWGHYGQLRLRGTHYRLRYDDSYAYRLASVVQKDLNWTGLERKLLIALAEQSDQAVWNMFSYAMRLTREPQLVGVSGSEGGHALIVYKIKDNALWVADPNYPSNPYRKIEYTNGKFKAVESGANAAEIAAGRSIRFDKIRYFAKTTLINWGNISKRWQQMKAKTIGNGIFPDYVLSI